MEMMKKIYAFTDNYRSAFIAYDFKENKVLYSNKTAMEMYGIREHTGLTEFFKNFDNNNLSLEVKIKTGFLNQGYATFDNILTKKSDGTNQLVHLMIGYFNEENTEIFIELTPKNDSLLEMALYQIEQSSKAEAILENDGNLTLFCCNQQFCKLLNAGQSQCLVQHGMNLGKIFYNDTDNTLLKEIHEKLNSGQNFSSEVQITTMTGEVKWIALELQRRVIDETGEKLMCSMVCIDEKKANRTRLHILAQYFESIQSLSGQSLYIIDVKSRTLIHKGDVAKNLGVPAVVCDYPESLYPKLHSDDLDGYKEFTKNSLSGIGSTYKCRLKVNSGEYQWHKMSSMIIRNEVGEVVEILGKMMNVHQEQEMKAENTSLNKYFSAMQELTDNIVYRIDLETMTLYHTLESPKTERLGKAIPDYVETFIHEKIIHPDDEKNYREFILERTQTDCTIRFAFISDEYQWYRISGKKIYGEDDTLKEIVGNLINVNSEKCLREEYSTLNQYFTAMQELSQEIIFRVDVKTKTFYHSDSNAHSFGIPFEIPNYVEVFIENKFIRPEDADSYREYTEKLFSGEQMEYEIQAAVGVGVYDWFHIRSKFIYDEHGQPTEIFGKMINIQKHKELENRAYHDMMTGALNKATFEEESCSILNQAFLEEKYALIFIDLDDFKGVNDTLGHSYGDALLTTVGKRLKRLVRGDDLVGRIGGDEFAVMLRNVDSNDSVLVRTNLMLESLQKDFSFEKKAISIKASVGVAIYPQHGTTYKELIGKADKAVYESKRRGKNVVSMYSQELDES